MLVRNRGRGERGSEGSEEFRGRDSWWDRGADSHSSASVRTPLESPSPASNVNANNSEKSVDGGHGDSIGGDDDSHGGYGSTGKGGGGKFLG